MKFRNYLFILLSSFSLFACTGDLKDEINELRSEIEALKNGEVNSLSTQISKIQATLSGLESTSTSLKSAIKELSDSQNDSKELLLESSSKIDALIDALYTYSEGLDEKQSDWTRATFSTLSYQSETEKILASIRKIVKSVDTNIAEQIKSNEETVKSWVGETLTGCYTSAEAQTALEDIKKESNNEIASAFEKANDEMAAEYKAAITAAITQNEGKIMAAHKTSIDVVNTKINELSIKIDALAERVEKLENRITTINYVHDISREYLNTETLISVITNNNITNKLYFDASVLVFKTNTHLNKSNIKAKIAYTCPAVMNSWGDILYAEANVDSILVQDDGDLLFVSWETELCTEFSLDYINEMTKLHMVNFSLQLKIEDYFVSSDYNQLIYHVEELDYRALEDILKDYEHYIQEEDYYEETSIYSFMKCYNESEVLFSTRKAKNQEEINKTIKKLERGKDRLYPKSELCDGQKGVNKGSGWVILYDGGPKWSITSAGFSIWSDKQDLIDEWNDPDIPGSEWRLPTKAELEKLCDPNLVYWAYNMINNSFIVYRRHSYDIGQTLFSTAFDYDFDTPHIIMYDKINIFSSNYIVDEDSGIKCPYLLYYWDGGACIAQTNIYDGAYDPRYYIGAIRLVCE